MMDWGSYWWGVASLPLLVLLLLLIFLAGFELFGRVGNQGVKCEWCDWRFAGLDENYANLGRVPDDEVNHPTHIHAHASRLWHRLVVTRTKRHRESWTRSFDSLSENSVLREQYLRHARRMGVKGRTFL